MGLTLVTDAVALPWTAAECKAEIPGYVAGTNNDATLLGCLNSATKWVQNQTCRQLMVATWLQTCNAWPDADEDGYYSIKLDLKPLSSITSVKYYDTNGTQQTVSSGDYWGITTSVRPTLTFNPDEFDWPSLQDARPDPIEIRFVAGYASASAVPDDLKRAIQLLTRYWYEINMAASPIVASQNPVDAQPVTYGEIPFGVWSIVNMYKADGYT